MAVFWRSTTRTLRSTTRRLATVFHYRCPPCAPDRPEREERARFRNLLRNHSCCVVSATVNPSRCVEDPVTCRGEFTPADRQPRSYMERGSTHEDQLLLGGQAVVTFERSNSFSATVHSCGPMEIRDIMERMGTGYWQGLKARILLNSCSCGTTEVVPCYKT